MIDVSSSPLFVVVSGLAASGKTSLAGPLAQALGVPLISKDAIKEQLFEAVGHGGLAWSRTLSSAADTAMVRIAQDLDGAVLDNFWYAETVDELLTPLPRPIVEVFSRCDPEVAYQRFQGRVRHPGHADKERDAPSARTLFLTRAQKLPLRTLGAVVEVDTDRPVEVDSVATLVIEAATLAAGASTPRRRP